MFQRSIDAGKHEGSQLGGSQLDMHTSLSVAHTQRRRKQIIHMLSLTCHIVLYGCSHRYE